MMNLKNLTILMATLTALVLVVGTAFAVNIPVPNGDFELGDTGFASAYTDYTGTGLDTGYGTVGTDSIMGLWEEGSYGVGTDPGAYHDRWAHFGDHTSGDGNMMIVNGDQTADVNVWASPVLSNTIPVVMGQTYYFSAYLTSVFPDLGTSPTAPAKLAFSINDVQISSDLTLSAPVGTWELFYASWTADSETANLSLINRNTIALGNDFALDDISLSTEVPSVPEPATMLLLGSGLLGLTGIFRRKIKKS